MNRSKEAVMAEKKMSEALKCPVCYNCVGIYLQQCANGHCVCTRCRSHIPCCPICRAKFIGRPVLLGAIIEQLIQLFQGLSSGDKAVDAYLKDLELPTSVPAQNVTAASQKVGGTINSSAESPIYNAAMVSRSVEVFLRQQASMVRPSSRT